MTTPRERKNAILNLRTVAMMIFMRGKKRPSLTEMRRLIRNALKHYPFEYELEQIAKCNKCKDIIGDE